jgi:lipoprotein-anchoring transpeptidase ErfK/SrfK
MGRKTQHHIGALIVTLKRLLAVAVAMYLLAVLVGWVLGFPVQAASATAEASAPTSFSPTPAAVADSRGPSATPEPTAEGVAGSPPRSVETPTEVVAVAPPGPAPGPGSSGCAARVQFLADVTVPDGSAFGPNEQFTKTWRVRNAGSCDWTGYHIVFVRGERMGALDQPIPDTPAGQAVEISVEMTAPGEPGDTTGYWQIQSADGASLGTLTCVIVVEGAGAEPAEEPTSIPPPAQPAAVDEKRWIDVDLSQQSLTAYEGGTPVRTTLVSTGLPATPTPVGQFRVWIKLRYDDMAGPGYYIADVPYVMYFHGGYGLHGVTWHGNFGHPMSHGCVNLPTAEAEWLFGFAEVGTLVNIHD